jgi:hypothetical protein
MQSTQISREADPHDIFVIEPDVVLAARADHADPISSLLTPPIQPAPERPAPVPVPPVDTTLHAPANDDIHIPRDIHVSGQRPPRGRWAARATIGFVFALCSAAAAEGWDHYGDTARDTVKAVVATWAPSLLTSQPAAAASIAAQPAAPTAEDQASAPPAPAAQPAQDAASTAAASTGPAPDQAQSLQSMAQDVASMGQQIASLKASIEQLKASQDQMSRDVARTPVARTSQARPSDIKPAEPSLRAKVAAALSPRPLAPPPRKPRPVYAPQASVALPPAISAPPMPPPQPAPMQYEPRAQAVDQSDGDVVMRPPMPVR